MRRTILALTIALVATVALQTSAATHYVSQTSPSPTPPYSTPDTAAHDIQSAVDVSVDGDSVLVAPGDYAVTNQITVTNAILLQGSGGASETIVTGNAAINQELRCIAISNGLAIADGFTFRRGTQDPGGAILVGGMIQNCVFTNFFIFRGSIVMSGGVVSNVIVSYIRQPAGTAVYCSDSGLITDSKILGNNTPGPSGGSAVVLSNSVLQYSVISGVLRSGNVVGPAVSAISSTVVGCIISNNFSRGKGAGAHLEGSVMDRCIVTGNIGASDGVVGTGGAGVFEINSIVRNSLIFSNSMFNGSPEPVYGALGGGVYMQGGALLNCTISGNSAQEFSGKPGGGGGVFAESGGITNCIIYFNSLNLNDRPSSNWFNLGPAIFDHCCTTPDPGGAGNVTADPQFVDRANNDYHLTPSSPCIDAGIVQSWMIGARDLDGNPRVSGTAVDMGAYEKPAATPQELVQGLIGEVNSLVSEGLLGHGNGNALIASLNAALRSLNRGSTNAACGQLGEFIGQVQEYIREGRLSDAAGQALISSANDLRTAIGCTGN